MDKFKRKQVICLEDGTCSKAYDKIGEFVNGFAIVVDNGLCGFIDEKLNEVVAPQYTDARNFCNGFAIISRGNACGAIDKTGKEVVSTDFFNLGDFTVKGLAPFKFAERYGAIDSNGNVVVKPMYRGAIKFSEGMARVRQDGRWGFINESFKVVIPIEFDLAGEFMCGRAFVLLANGEQCYINKNGEIIE